MSLYTDDQPFSSTSTKIRSSSSLFLIPSVHHLISESSNDSKVKDVLPERFKAACKLPRSSTDNLTSFVQEKPVALELLESVVFEGITSEELPVAPTLSVGEPLREGCVHITVPVDRLALVHWETSLGDLSLCLKEGICKQLQAIRGGIYWKVCLFACSVLVLSTCVQEAYAICCCCFCSARCCTQCECLPLRFRSTRLSNNYRLP